MNLAANGMTALALLGAAFPVYHLFKNRAEAGALYLLALCLALVVYPFNLILLQGETAVLFRFSVVSLVAPLYFLAIFAYLRYRPRFWNHLKLGLFCYMAAAFAAPWLGGDWFLDFAQLQPRADVREYVYQHGPLSWTMKIASYVLVLVGCAAVLHRFNSSRSNRAHIVSLALFPLCTAVLDLLAVLIGFSTYHGITMMQISGTVTLFALSYALMQHRMLVRVPVSRNTLMSYLHEGLCVISEHGEIADCNDAFAQMVGKPSEHLLGTVATQTLPEPILNQLQELAHCDAVTDIEIELDNPGRILSISISRITDSQTLIVTLTDITERKRLLMNVAATAEQLQSANEQLEEVSRTDPLTGLGNRRKLQEALAVRDLEPSTDAIGLLMIDVDHFKAVNDTHGHDAGDLVLVELANIMRDTFRTSDRVVRWGGEEFLILVEQSDPHSIQALAERLRQRIRALTITLPNNVTLRVTASIGALLVGPGESSNDALRRVDQLLYEAKQEGRDRVRAALP